jgi:Spy/CpxP family protein refolding chaperone
MRNTLLLLLLATSALAQPFGPPPGGDARLIPPPRWWQQDEIADAVKLDANQVERLDALQKEHGDAIAKLERDLSTATRDLRTSLEAQPPVTAKIIAAGDRLGDLRTSLFHQQIVMLAAQRAILTRRQWTSLQAQLESHRPPMRGRGPGGPGPGRPPNF